MSKVPPGQGKHTSGNRRLSALLLQKDNRVCADCGAPDPKWASANIGVFICLKCSGVHRNLGTHISKVLSVSLDEWSDDEIDAMIEVGGNADANSIYEAFIPQGYSKPGPDSTVEERTDFIRSKYELQEFLKPSLRILSNPSKNNSFQADGSIKATESFASQRSEGMVEFVGMLKVIVLKGVDLAVRDMRSSDPYVVLTLGHQKVQTKVVKSNLNPVWNEELMLSVPLDFGSLKVEVYDYDTFSGDDIMGQADVDIQPLITSAMAFRDPPDVGEPIQIGKWLRSDDNALLEDSLVMITDGTFVQEVSLKLQNVESGEMFLRLEWISLDQ